MKAIPLKGFGISSLRFFFLIVWLTCWSGLSFAQKKAAASKPNKKAVVVPNVKPIQLKDFPKKVMSIYKEMTFSGVELPLQKVILRDIPVGIAFAHFDRKRNKRYILLNLRYFFGEWQKDSTKTRYQLEGILAHEWAHHFLGHVFEKGDIIKERDADLIAGRILYELGTSTDIDSIQDQRLTAALTILPADGDPTHLHKEARTFLILKGFMTGKVIGILQKTDRKNLLTDLEKYFDNAGKRKTAELRNLTNKKKAIIDGIKQRIEFIEDSLSVLDTSRAILSDTISFIKNKLGKQKVELIQLAVNQAAQFTKDTTDIVEKYNKFNADNELQTEAIYNLLYVNEPQKIQNQKLLKSYWQSDTTDTGVYRYELRGMTLFFDKNAQKVTFQEDKKTPIKIESKPTTAPFLYQFVIDRSTFYIDHYCNLWTETIAAKQIKNKLFLEKRTIINP